MNMTKIGSFWFEHQEKDFGEGITLTSAIDDEDQDAKGPDRKNRWENSFRAGGRQIGLKSQKITFGSAFPEKSTDFSKNLQFA